MSDTFFSPENSWKRFFFVNGYTADEFFTDGLMKLSMEEAIHLELQRSGYQRIVYFDHNHKLYCYDEKSFDLMSGDRHRQTAGRPAPAKRRKRGLGMGRYDSSSSGPGDTTVTGPAEEVRAAGEEDSSWDKGSASGIRLRRQGDWPLHKGTMHDSVVMSMVRALMEESSVKTAIVINDANDFKQYFNADPVHMFTSVFMNLRSDNENIIVLVYPDMEVGSLYTTDQFSQENKDANIIGIACPNILELRNLLFYHKFNGDIKVHAREIDEIAMILRRGMPTAHKGKGMRIKELVQRLKGFGTDQWLTPDACYELLDVKKMKTAEEQISEMIGMDSAKKMIGQFDVGNTSRQEAADSMTSSRLRPDLPRPQKTGEMIHFVFTGNPGTGKTTLAGLMGQRFFEMGYLESGHVVEVDRSDLVAGYVGQTAIKTAEKVRQALGGVLFIDEAYSLKRRKNSGEDFGQEAIDTLCKLMDQYKGQLIVVAAGYEREMKTFIESNPGLKSRFTVSIHLDDYSPEEMQKLLELYAAKNECAFSEDLQAAIPDFCENWVNLAGENWGNAREAVNLINGMKRAWKQDRNAQTLVDGSGKALCVLERRHLPENLLPNLKPVAEMRAEALDRLNEMTGLAEVKRQVEKIRCRIIAGNSSDPVPGHYIFAGNPGTGKTTVARYMGMILRNLGLLRRGHLVEYTATQLMAAVYNDDNRGDFDAVANKALDGVLFIDEAYQLTQDRRGTSILDAVLPFMENNRRNVCVILAGYEDKIEQIFEYNEGFQNRFQEIIHFEDYSGQELCEILQSMLREEEIDTDQDFREFSLRILTRYIEIHGKKGFGNARYIRNEYIPACKDAQALRLMEKYGEAIPAEETKQLTGADIPKDLARLAKTPLDPPDTRGAAERLDDLIGYASIKEELRRILQTAEFNRTNALGIPPMNERLHWVLEGKPGTGKTTIANLIGQVYKEAGILDKGHTVKVTRADLVGRYMGETAQKTRRCIEKAMGGVLFIDEAYTLTKVEGGEGGYGQEAIGELVEAMEVHNGEFAVVMAGYPDDMEQFLRSNAGLSSRIRKFILDDYSGEELTRIFLSKCRKQKVEIDMTLQQKLPAFFAAMKRRISRSSDWGNGREAENLLRDMLHNWMLNPIYRTKEDGGQVRVLAESHIPENLQRCLREAEHGTIKRELTAQEEIESLVGFTEVKDRLNELIALSKLADEQDMPELLDDVFLHWVLKGNPGTGKTTVARLIGKVYKSIGLLSRGHTVEVTRADLVAGYVGQTALKTKRKIEEAMGGVLFIDEAYMLKSAGGSGNDFGQEAIDTIMKAMSDYAGEFAVITAGYPREMDIFIASNPGLLRRFSETFLLPDYTASEVTRIFEGQCCRQGFLVEEDLHQVIEPVFANMIKVKRNRWENGSEAEKLLAKLKSRWAYQPVIRTDESGRKLKYFGLQHLPEEYLDFLHGADPESLAGQETEEGKASSSGKVSIERAEMPAPIEGYSYENHFSAQVDGLVFIRTETLEGAGSGSGALISRDGYILTCSHVVRGSREIKVRLRYRKAGKEETMWEPADVVWEDEHLDAAIIRIREGRYPALAMRPVGTESSTGEPIYLWGYPFGGSLSDNLDVLQPSLYQGFISSIQQKDGLDRINTNMEAKRGCSGGPVFSKKDGNIIGILCGSQTAGGDGLVEEINYVLPVKYIWEHIELFSVQDAAQAQTGEVNYG